MSGGGGGGGKMAVAMLLASHRSGCFWMAGGAARGGYNKMVGAKTCNESSV